MTEQETPDDERIVIHANSNVTRGKFAAAAVHAALTAAGAHPGCPVIVLGAKPSEIEQHHTVIRDAGKTEFEPGTVTAGTDWRGTATAPAGADDYEAGYAEGFHHGRSTPAEREITDEMVRDALNEYLRAETGGKTRAMRSALEAALRSTDV